MNRISRWFLRKRMARDASRMLDWLMENPEGAAQFIERDIPWRRGFRR